MRSQTSSSVALDDLVAAMDAFVAAKGWYGAGSKRPQTPRNLATSLMLEAAELLECFQWSESCDSATVAAELADIVLYTCQLAGVLDVDLEGAVLRKLRINHNRSWDGDVPLTEKPAS